MGQAVEAFLMELQVASRACYRDRPTTESSPAALAGFQVVIISAAVNKIPDSMVKASNVIGIGSSKYRQLLTDYILNKPNSCSRLVRHYSTALYLNFSCCMVKMDGNTTDGISVLCEQSEKENMGNQSTCHVQLLINVSTFDNYSRDRKLMVLLNVMEGWSCNMDIKRCVTLDVNILEAWAYSDFKVCQICILLEP